MGVEKSTSDQRLRKSENDVLVVLIGAGDLDQVVRSKERNEALKEMHRRAVVAAPQRAED
jgi:hypothetical protein